MEQKDVCQNVDNENIFRAWQSGYFTHIYQVWRVRFVQNSLTIYIEYFVSLRGVPRDVLRISVLWREQLDHPLLRVQQLKLEAAAVGVAWKPWYGINCEALTKTQRRFCPVKVLDVHFEIECIRIIYLACRLSPIHANFFPISVWKTMLMQNV